MEKKIYIIENLDCANCAAKIEQKIKALPEVAEASITFTTRQLRVTAEDPDTLLEQMQALAQSVEPDAKIVTRENDAGRENHEHHHHEGECCGHGHEHHDTDAHEHSHEAGEGKELLLGAVLFAVGLLLEWLLPQFPAAHILVYIGAYLVLGVKILLTAGKNLIRGHVFDENFLMSLATIGAFAIQEYPEAVGVMLFYRIGEYFEDRAVERSRSQIMEAVDLRPETVNLMDGQTLRAIPAAQAQIGDLLLVRPGDRIPLDGVVISGESRLDTAPINGEPVPVGVRAGDAVISGCVNTSGQLIIRVEKPLSESMVTRILNSVENAAASKPKIDRFITRFARVYTPIVVISAVCTAVIPPLLFQGDWNYWVYTALSFLVMSCPCALVLSVPLAFFSGIGMGSRKGILFKGGASIEAMNGVKAVVMDKTGTITRGDFVVQQVTGAETTLELCASCEQTSTHPIAVSVVQAAAERGMTLQQPDQLEELPGRGIRARLQDRTILCGNRTLMEEQGVDIADAAEQTGGTQVLVAADGKLVGCILIADTLKDGASSAVTRLTQRGIATAMLTGDAEESAQAVAKQVGIGEVYGKLLPQEKLERLQQLRERYGSVMFVGDGINDAPVLAGADVGAAMGSGADAAIEAADVVFMTSDVQAIPEALDIARKTNGIAWQNVVFALVVKAAVMILGLCGYASMWMAVFADSGVAMLCVLNSIRLLYRKKK